MKYVILLSPCWYCLPLPLQKAPVRQGNIRWVVRAYRGVLPFPRVALRFLPLRVQRASGILAGEP